MSAGFARRLATVACLACAAAATSRAACYQPPWGPPPPGGGLTFAVPPFDQIADLYGDVVDPQLTIFFGGNQFMVVPDLIAAFKRAYPQYVRVFVETLPPGKLASQIEAGALIMGSLRIAAKPDLYTAGRDGIDALQRQKHWFTTTYDYADNELALMVRAGNPHHVAGLADLGRRDVRVSMPNPAFEGIGRQIEAALRKAGGEALERSVMQAKVADGSTLLTQIHHRQSPLNLLEDRADAAPVWLTEGYFQQHVLHFPVETITIAAAHNVRATYAAAVLATAPHPRAARDFLAFLATSTAQGIYRRYGFQPPHAQAR
ncbi:MAG TPA: substrate-binding domain-containing protein [Steroidobacteraceae bacterium]|nr:substrate-binding domain-containing protein [Steroidobacteraceae bacterium]